jgi:hypothetical protein
VAKLEKRPGVPLIAMFVPNRDPLTNPTKVFEGDCLARYGGLLDEFLADAVVSVGLEAGFAAAHLPQATLGVLGANPLKPLASQVIVVADEVNNGAGEALPLTIRCQVGDAQVYTQRALVWFCHIWRFPVLRDVQIVNPCTPDQIGPAHFPCRVYQHFVLARTKHKTTDNTAFQGVEGDVVQAHQAIGASIVADTAMWPEGRAGLMVLRLHGFDGLNSLGAGSDRQLRTQLIVQARFAIHPMMRCVRVDNPFLPTHLRNPRRRRIEGALRHGQSGLVGVHLQLAANCAREGGIYGHSILFYLRKWKPERGRRFLPKRKHWGLRAASLVKIEALPVTMEGGESRG